MSSFETAPVPLIESRILLIRGHKVLLDADLATLYQVETKALNRAVKRNQDRLGRYENAGIVLRTID